MRLHRVERPGVIVRGEAGAVEHHAQVAAEQFGVAAGGGEDVPAGGLQLGLQPATDKARGADDGPELRHRGQRPPIGWCSLGSLWRRYFGLTSRTIEYADPSNTDGSFTATMLNPCGGPSR